MKRAIGACATAAAFSVAIGVWVAREIDRAVSTIGRPSI